MLNRGFYRKMNEKEKKIGAMSVSCIKGEWICFSDKHKEKCRYYFFILFPFFSENDSICMKRKHSFERKFK